MAVVRSGETDYDKELKRWDMPKRLGGEHADGFEMYPLMLYRAWKHPDTGKVFVVHELFPRLGTAKARNEQEVADLRRQGYFLTVQEAFDAFEADEMDRAHRATRVAYDVSQMSEQAQREYAALDAQSSTHVLDVPAPKRRGGRPKRKPATVAAE